MQETFANENRDLTERRPCIAGGSNCESWWDAAMIFGVVGRDVIMIIQVESKKSSEWRSSFHWPVPQAYESCSSLSREVAQGRRSLKPYKHRGSCGGARELASDLPLSLWIFEEAPVVAGKREWLQRTALRWHVKIHLGRNLHQMTCRAFPRRKGKSKRLEAMYAE